MKYGKLKSRTCFARYRVSVEEYAELIARAARQGLTLSEFLRARTLSDEPPVIRAGPEPAPGGISEGDRLIADQIRRVGVLLNQIAHMQNMLGVPAPAGLEPLVLEIRRYMEWVRARENR